MQIITTLREFLLSAFKLKQKEIEIPMSSLKKDLEIVLRSLIEDVKKRYQQKLKKCEIHNQVIIVDQVIRMKKN